LVTGGSRGLGKDIAKKESRPPYNGRATLSFNEIIKYIFKSQIADNQELAIHNLSFIIGI
jgi:hypothetical protein